MTRRSIVAAARDLFATRGYVATRVEDIARSARVAPATVYAVGGGKQGLLRQLVHAWMHSPAIGSAYERIAALDDPDAVLRETAAGTRAVREEWGDIIRVVLATAPHDPTAAQALATATEAYRQGLLRTAQRLVDLGALREAASVDHAVDVLWFYFGYSGYTTLVDDAGWTLDRAEHWLHRAARAALLDAPHGER